jgi:hypothetical protein
MRALVHPLDGEIHGFEQRPLFRPIGEDAERVAGDGAVVGRPSHGVSQRAMARQQGQGVRQIAISLLPVFQGAPPESAFLGVAAPEGQNDRQGDLAVMKIVADRFS